MKKLKLIFDVFKEMHCIEKRIIPLSIIVAIVTSILPFVDIWFTSKIIDLLDVGSPKSNLLFYIIFAIVLNSVLLFLNYLLSDMYFMYRSLMYNKELQNVTIKLFKIEYHKLENNDFKELVHKHSEAQDRVFSAFVQFSWMIRDFLSGMMTMIISAIIIVPLLKVGFKTTGITYFEKPIFLITIFVAIAIMTFIILIVALKMNKEYFKANDEYSKLDRIFYYFLNMFSDYNTGKEIRLYKEQSLIEYTATDKMLIQGEKILKNASLNSAKSSSLVAILGAIIGFGIYLFIGVKGLYGLFSIGSLVLYYGSFMQIINGIMKMAVTFGKTEEFVPLVNYYFEIMKTDDEMKYGSKELDLNGEFEIEFKDVSFKYPNTKNYVLKNINIKISNGEKIAIVGRNGSGKTTFIKLLCRLYDVTDGEVLINKINIKEYSKESIRKLYSVVFQDFKIFSITLAQNISVSYDYDNIKLLNALDKANIKDRVLNMEKQEQTYLFKDIDKFGVEISGGEAQKLALARALYKDAPIVILDEPTAALDPLAENEIYNRFNSFVANKTAIFISHRLASCSFCDKVVVFDKAKIVEEGTQRDLINKKGVYSNLWDLQARYYI